MARIAGCVETVNGAAKFNTVTATVGFLASVAFRLARLGSPSHIIKNNKEISIARKRVYGGTQTPDLLSPPKNRRSKNTRKLRAKNSTVYTRKPIKQPREP